MAYIWGFGKIPDYLTAVREAQLISSEVATNITNGKEIDKKLILGYVIKTKKIVTYKHIRQYDILKETMGVPLVNGKVLQILETECAGKFQAIPTIIRLPDGNEINDYWVINVTNKVPTLSLENCVRYKEYLNEPNIRASIFYTVAHKEDIVEREDLCRDSILNENLIFISERLYNIFKKEKIKGGGFPQSLRDSVVFV
jgi:hypothetical protein